MDPTKNQDLESEPQAEKEEIIDLTEVLDEGASETVIEISAKMDELDSLDLKTLLAEEAEDKTEPPAPPGDAPGEKDESLEDLLSSLQETPEEPPTAPEAESAPEPAPPPEMAVPPPVAAAPEEERRQQGQAALSQDQIREIVREGVQEPAERLCRELFPEVPSQGVSREIAALKKSLEEEI